MRFLLILSIFCLLSAPTFAQKLWVEVNAIYITVNSERQVFSAPHDGTYTRKELKVETPFGIAGIIPGEIDLLGYNTLSEEEISSGQPALLGTIYFLPTSPETISEYLVEAQGVLTDGNIRVPMMIGSRYKKGSIISIAGSAIEGFDFPLDRVNYLNFKVMSSRFLGGAFGYRPLIASYTKFSRSSTLREARKRGR